jgi:hypothetical protein
MTVIGDAVNLTARIESATKMFGVPPLVSDDLFAETGRSIRHRAVHRATTAMLTEGSIARLPASLPLSPNAPSSAATQPSAGPVFSVQVVTALA